MCLAVPSKIIEFREGNIALCDTLGMRREILLDLMYEQVNVGDYVLIHVGYAISKLNEEQAVETLNMYKDLE